MTVTAIVDYDSLIAAVDDHLLGSSAATSSIPLFITLAEAYLQRALRNRLMEVRETLVTTAGQERYPLPSDYLELRVQSLDTNPRRLLTFRTPQQLDTLYTNLA